MAEAKTESVQAKRIESWIKGHLWLIAIVVGALVFIGLCGPLVSTHGATSALVGEGDDAYYEFSEASSRYSVWANGVFGVANMSWPFIALYALAFVAFVFVILGKKWNDCYVAALLLYVCLGIIFFTGNTLYDFTACSSLIGVKAAADNLAYYSTAAGTKLAFGCVISGVVSFVAAFFCLGAANAKDSFNVLDLTEIGLLSAMAIGLQFIKIEIGSTGGSINLGLIPLFVIALRHGPTKGFIASAFVFGLVTCLTDGYGLFTYPLDYLVGFGGCAALGFFRRLVFTKNEKGYSGWGFLWISLGVIIASLVRFVGSSMSSIVNYGYSFQGAIVYNSVYIPVTGAVSLAAMLLLYIPMARLQKIFPPKETSFNKPVEAAQRSGE
ncbi:MAG: energy-coupled thiamine transporter ThiT [Bacilli bacterium]|jgi:thiamine transporter ThiT|nr:energy-coupled thiamine transporter ThiT [Bacilli bacterium]